VITQSEADWINEIFGPIIIRLFMDRFFIHMATLILLVWYDDPWSEIEDGGMEG